MSGIKIRIKRDAIEKTLTKTQGIVADMVDIILQLKRKEVAVEPNTSKS